MEREYGADTMVTIGKLICKLQTVVALLHGEGGDSGSIRQVAPSRKDLVDTL